MNDQVRVQLTPRGFEVYLEAVRANSAKTFKTLNDAGGLVLQLWEVMAIFGPHIHMGCVPLFATEIELLRNNAE